MLNNKKESKEPVNLIKDRQDNILGNTIKKYEQKIESGKKIGKEIMLRIEDTTKTGTEFIKSNHYLESLTNSSSKIKEKTQESKSRLKKQSPKLYKKISNGFFYFFEAIVGRIKIGLQYGSPSLDTLERLAKLKELGILTDEEFANKKKKILDRI